MARSIAFPKFTGFYPNNSFTDNGIQVICTAYSSDKGIGYAFDGNTGTTWYCNSSGTHSFTITCPKPTYLIGYEILMGQYYGSGYKIYFDDKLAYDRTIGNNGKENIPFAPRLVTKIKVEINPTGFINVAEFKLFKLVDTLAIIKINDSLYSFDDAGKMKLVSSSASEVSPLHFLNEGFNIKDMTTVMEKQIKDVGKVYSILTMSN